jgi:hypothetical protein
VIKPGADEILSSIITTVEAEIAPLLEDDEYAASLCRSIAQLLRHVQVRVEAEVPTLTADNAELRALLESLAAEHGSVELTGVLPAVPAARHAARDDLEQEAFALRAALVDVIEAHPDEESPVRDAYRGYLANQLRRQLPWQQNAYTGPRR